MKRRGFFAALICSPVAAVAATPSRPVVELKLDTRKFDALLKDIAAQVGEMDRRASVAIEKLERIEGCKVVSSVYLDGKKIAEAIGSAAS